MTYPKCLFSLGQTCWRVFTPQTGWRFFTRLERWTNWFVSTGTNSIKCLVNWIQVWLRICVRLRSIHPHDGVGYVSKERRFSMESILKTFHRMHFLWKRTNCLVVIQKRSWRGKFVASAHAWLREEPRILQKSFIHTQQRPRKNLLFKNKALYTLNKHPITLFSLCKRAL